MNKPEAPWDQRPPCQEGPPEPDFVGRPPKEESPAFQAIRRIELLGRLHHMAFGTLFREDGLPPAQAGAMRVIIRYPGLSQRELADKLHIQRATATVMLQKMEKAGYIDRRPDQEDQRISRIYPTESALTLDAENQKRVNAYFARCVSEIPQERFEGMMDALGQMVQNLQEILSENPEPSSKE